jgi:RHS repeat-associated protein
VLLATDNKNSVLVEVVGNDTNHLAYSAYGHQSAQENVVSQLGFNGELHEAKTGWYLLGNGYRAYNPRLMRFHSPDSWSPFGRGGLNPYMYCVGDPVNRSDPTGHWPPFKAVGRFFKTLGPGKSRPVDLNKLDLSGAMEMIGQAHNARINYVAPPRSSTGLGAILYTLGTAHPMRGDSPRITSVIETARHHPGYVDGAAMAGLSSRPSRATPQMHSVSGGYSGGSSYRHDAPPPHDSPPSYNEAMALGTADTFAKSQQGKSFIVNRVSVPNSHHVPLNPPPMVHPQLPPAPDFRAPPPPLPGSSDSTPPRSRNPSGDPPFAGRDENRTYAVMALIRGG